MTPWRTWRLFVLACVVLCSCTRKPDAETEAPLITDPANTVTLDGISVGVDPGMRFTVSTPAGLTTVTRGWAELEADGLVINHFGLEGPGSRTQATTALGTAQRLRLHGLADLPGGGKLRRILTLDTYPQWPTAVFLQTSYQNLSTHDVLVSRRADAVLLMDSSRVDAGLERWAFWSMQGAAIEWPQDFAFPLTSSFARDNFLGTVEHVAGGGGTPMVYNWNRHLGVGLAHVETRQHNGFMPVTVMPDGRVRVALEERALTTVAAGGLLVGLQTMITVNHGDFFDPLALYSSVLAAQGEAFPAADPEDYAPAWCAWGFGFDVTPDQVTAALPKVKELGFRWATLDDGWFDNYGDLNPRAATFPGGATQMRSMVNAIHQSDMRAQLWWYPLAADDGAGSWDGFAGTSEIVLQHPDWLCLNVDGSVFHSNRGTAYLDPAVQGVQDYTVELVHRFVEDWGFDGFKLDNIYAVPPCYNSPYHARPEDSLDGMATVYALIQDTARALKPHSVTQVCPCAVPPTFTLYPHFDQGVVSDALNSDTARQRMKFFKAQLGPRAPIYGDHVENIDHQIDFASMIGPGGVPGSKFTWPPDALPSDDAVWALTPEKEAALSLWMGLYARYRLAEGDYLNLYDLAFDFPEAHVIRKDQAMYYSFFASRRDGVPSMDVPYTGNVELRGLEARVYQLTNIVTGADLGTVTGPVATIPTTFTGSLLVEARP